jgi:hypothetical protein
MTDPYGTDNRLTNPIVGTGFGDTQHMAGILVLGSMLFLYLVRRGFRGISAGGLSLGVR